MEPVSTATLLAVAGKLGPPTVQVFGTQLVGKLSPGESKRLRRALAEVVLQVSHEHRPSPAWHPIEARRWRKAKKRIEKELRPAVGPDRLVGPGDQSEDGNAVEQATGSWREALARRFRDAASAGLEREPDDWRLVLGPLSPSQWGAAVQRGIEWRMAADPKLRQILARLDWGSEQASREAAAFVSLSYLKLIPLALALASGVFLALVAIAVILAID
jgi:hypothetical protein